MQHVHFQGKQRDKSSVWLHISDMCLVNKQPVIPYFAFEIVF